MWVIIKYMKNNRGKELPVVILDTHEEVLEFESEEEAENQKNLFLVNSDSGYRYEIKKI
jgi:hypothetical protein